jgi:Zn-dependent M28 family amino/carboxypeptidase
VRIALIPLMLLFSATAASAGDAEAAAMLRDKAMAGSSAYSIVESLTTEVGPRLAGTEAEARARDWAVAKLKALGFRNVRIEPFDMPVWERGAEEGAIVAPFPQPLVLTALGNSGSTGPGGLQAEVVKVADVDTLRAIDPKAIAGKIVFITHAMKPTQDGSSYGYFGPIRRSAPSIAASKGAAAILIRSLGTSSHRFPHTGGTNWAAGVTPIPAAAVSAPDAEQLDRVLARGKPVSVRLLLTPRVVGTRPSGNVIGEIPGTAAPDELVVIGGHLDSWDRGTGAIDDGAGVAIATAAAKTIMDAGLKPRRTIRVVLWGAEEVGLFGAQAYAKAHAGAKHVVAAESDFGADRVWKFGHRVAESGKLLAAAIAKLLEPLGVTYDKSNDNRGGPDVGPLAALGVATFSPEQSGLDYFNLHHTPDDTLDKIDPKKLDQSVAVYATMTWMAANSDVALGPVGQ